MAKRKKRTTKRKKKESFTSKIKRGLISLAWKVMGIVILLGIAFYFAVYSGIFGIVPSEEELKHLIRYEASEVYSSDGVLLGRYFVENRSDANLEEISPNIINALIATEDARFYEHKGIDQRSMLRVLVKTLILGQNAGGGSTISQQLAKNVFGRKSFGKLTMPVVKTREALIANRFNQVYTKDEILELYLNTVSFGEDTYGIKTACERFFSTLPNDIKPEQAAVLIGMLKAPTSYNPRLHPERSKERRNVVLNQMAKHGYLTENENNSLQALPLSLDYSTSSDDDVLAQYFRAQLKTEIQSILDEYTDESGNTYNLLTDGLRINTTIDSRMQRYAQEAVQEHLKNLQPAFTKDISTQGKLRLDGSIIKQAFQKTNKYSYLKEEGLSYNEIVKESKQTLDSIKSTTSRLQSGFLVSDPKNGNILAWVGGRNWQQSQYDHITSKRQVGSVFKPIVYAKALEDGFEPCEFISNRQVRYTQYDDWTPQNSDGEYTGSYSLLGGLTKSINTISVSLIMETGIEEVIEFAQTLGVVSDLPEVPSIALGVANMSVKEISTVYSTFANEGNKSIPHFISTIKDEKGRLIYEEESVSESVIDAKTAKNITNMMRSVADQGTAVRLRSWYGIDGPIAAKTGTTQNHADGWFVGYTPDWLGVVWVGADNPALHFSTIKDGQGANMALPIWSKFYQKVQRDVKLGRYYGHNFQFSNSLSDCELYKKDNFLVKALKKKPKKNRKTGLENDEPQSDKQDKPKKKKRFWDLFKKKNK